MKMKNCLRSYRRACPDQPRRSTAIAITTGHHGHAEDGCGKSGQAKRLTVRAEDRVFRSRKMRQLCWVLLTSSLITPGASAQTAKIVGTGAATCATFLSDIARNPISEREYFSWAQGYISGILMRAPPGKDENLDLTPREFPVKNQLEFFRSFCAANQQDDYADAAASLYQRLRDFVPK
jgi:hypothetical protein